MNLVERTWDWLLRSRRKLATAAVGLLALQLAVHVVFGSNGMMVYLRKKTEHRTLQLQTEELQRENERLSRRIQSLKTDPQTIEKEAREQLRYAKPGEVVYTMPADKTATPPATANAAKR